MYVSSLFISFKTILDEFKLKINQVPLFEQKIFFNQLDDKFRMANPIDTSKEEQLKHRLYDLVNNYLPNDSRIDAKKSSNDLKNKLETSLGRHANNNKQVTRRVKYDENALSNSVFEMEDIDESAENDKFSPDFNSDEGDEGVNSQDELQGQEFQRSILKKRNSNIGDGVDTRGAAADSRESNAYLSFNNRACFLFLREYPTVNPC